MADEFYGTDVRLTDLGDLMVSPNGGIVLIDGPLNVAQATVMRMRTWPGELPLHPDYGSTLEKRLVGAKGDPELARAVANAELRNAIQGDRRLLSAEQIVITQDPKDLRRLQISALLHLAGGDQLDITSLTELSTDDATVVDPSLFTADPDLILDTDAFLLDDDTDASELPDIEEFLGDDLTTGLI